MKKNIGSIACLLAFIVTTSCLHLTSLPYPVHLQTAADKQSYLNSLLKIESDLANQVEALQKSVHENTKKSEQF